MLKNPKQLKFIAPLDIPNGKSGDVEIERVMHPANEPVTAVSMRTAIFTGQKPLEIRYNVPVSYTVLKDKDGIWMTDNPGEQVSMHNDLKKCKGRVLVGGLGLGYFAKKLQEKKNVTQVIVVEISQDVINLVWEHLKLDRRFDKRFTIIHNDIKVYLKGYCNHNFDWVYLDVWRADSEYEFVNNVLPLKRLVHKHACNKVSHVLSWQEDVMLGQLRQGLQQQVMFNFDEVASKSNKAFDKKYSSKYLKTRRAFWLFVRENKLDAKTAETLIPTYMMWIQNGMQGEF